MIKRLFLEKNENFRLVVGGETEIGIHINSEGHPKIKWKKRLRYPNGYRFENKFPEVVLPGWMKRGV